MQYSLLRLVLCLNLIKLPVVVICFQINPMWLNKTVGLETCLKLLLTRLYEIDETFLLVSYKWEDFVFPFTVSNQRILVKAAKPITPLKFPGDIYNNYVIYAEDEVELRVVLTKLTKTSVWDVSNSPRGRYVVVTSTTKGLEKLFETCWSFDIMNVVLVVNIGNNQDPLPKLYTSNPFGNGGKCGRKSQLDSVQQCDEKVNINFTKSFRNLNECTVKLVTPVKLTRNMKAEGAYTFLASILELFSQIINTSTSLVVSLNKMEALYNSTDDIVLSTEVFRATEVYQNFDLSEMLIRDQPIWMFPKSPLISNLKIITTVFDQTVWLALLLTLAVSVGAWWVMGKFEDKQSEWNNLSYSFLLIWGFLFGISNNFLPSLRALKMLVMFNLIYSILVSCSFQARLASVLTQPGREPPIRSMEELAEAGLWVLETKAFLSATSGLADKENWFARLYRKVVFLDELNFTESVTLVAYNSNYTSSFGWIAFSWFSKEKSMVDVIEHSTGTLPADMSFAMRKGHYIMHTLNEISGRLIESGFPGKLFSEASGLSYARVAHTSETVLTLNHLGGVFIWWTAGLFIACLVFLVETLIFYYKNSKLKLEF